MATMRKRIGGHKAAFTKLKQRFEDQAADNQARIRSLADQLKRNGIPIRFPRPLWRGNAKYHFAQANSGSGDVAHNR